MLNLKNVDIININCLNPAESSSILDISTKNIKFNRSILFTDKLIESDHEIVLIDPIRTIEQYSDFCLQLNKYINNDFVLIVQNDGFIINDCKWYDYFLKYDYIGAPWKQTKVIGQKIGNGGFSLRSKKFLEFSSKFSSAEGEPEDNFLCISKYYEAIDYGCHFAPIDIASIFSFEHPHDLLGKFDPRKHFGFHGKHNLLESKKYIKK